MTYKIPLLRPYFDSEELEEIQNVLNSGWVSKGQKAEEFEAKVAEYLNVKYAVAVMSCTAALHLSLLSIGVKEEDEVLVADYTFPATGHSVLYCRAKPRFVDVDPRTYNIDPGLLEEKVTDRTKAIIPVHTFGQPAEMDGIIDIAKKYNLAVIEDAACTFGATYKNRYAGTIGNIGCFSFHARKGITTGEGGMVVTNDRKLAEKIQRLSVFGIVSAWDREKKTTFTIPEFTELGYNYKMSDINAAVGVAQLKKLPYIIKRKQLLARYWDEALESIDLIKPPYVSTTVTHIYQSYVALLDRRINREKVVEALMKEGVQTQIGTYASHAQPIYHSQDVCSYSLDIFRRSLALPMYYTLQESDIDTAASILKKVLEDQK